MNKTSLPLTHAADIERLWDHVSRLAKEAATKRGMLPGEFFANGRRKPSALVEARREFVERLRDTVWYRDGYYRGRREIKTISGLVEAVVCTELSRDGWKRMSNPMMARALGMNQSSFACRKPRSSKVKALDVSADYPIVPVGAACPQCESRIGKDHYCRDCGYGYGRASKTTSADLREGG